MRISGFFCAVLTENIKPKPIPPPVRTPKALLLFFKKYEISLLKDFLVIRYGVIFSVTRILPLNKIIYVKVLKTPVLKAFALDVIIIKTIKGVLILPELKCEESEKIKRKI